MPELPEVEIVTQNLTQIIQPPVVIKQWKFFRKDLRFAIPQARLKKIIGQKILKISRRAKYILFELADEVIISHLGMTGSWRLENSDWKKRTHDHLAFSFKSDNFLVYEDPRRFGFIELIQKSQLSSRFKNLGYEPLADNYNLNSVLKEVKAPIKTALMNQKYIVGIGNIYASEILFAARVSPLKSCMRVSDQQYQNIQVEIKKILNQAIQNGGSSIDNYRNGYGEKGDYQTQHQVYGRESEACFSCGRSIQSQALSGRSTFWCAHCQK